MKIQSVTVSFSATVPTGNYANVVINQTWTAEVEPGEDAEKVSAELFERIRAHVIAAVKPIYENKVEGMEAALSILPKDKQDKIRAEFGPAMWLKANVPESFVGANAARRDKAMDILDKAADLHAEARKNLSELKTQPPRRLGESPMSKSLLPDEPDDHPGNADERAQFENDGD